jgi:predicted NAD/FAD-binding protein
VGPASVFADAFLNRLRFSSYFVDYFITPLMAAVWSCAGDDVGAANRRQAVAIDRSRARRPLRCNTPSRETSKRA